MEDNEQKSADTDLAIGQITMQVNPGLEIEKLTRGGLKRILDRRVKRKRQVSIMGAKQSITFSLRKRYIERARIVAEYMGISLSTYIERCITKDNARYTRIINALEAEVRKHDEVIGRIDSASASIDPLRTLSQRHGVNNNELLQAVAGLKDMNFEDEIVDEEQEEE